MNQTQKNHAINRVRKIIEGKLEALAKTDKEELDIYRKACSVTPIEATQYIMSKKVLPFSKAKLKSQGSTSDVTALFDFSKIKEAKLKKAGLTEAPTDSIKYVKFSVNKSQQWPATYNFRFQNNKKIAVDLVKQATDLEDTIMLSGDVEALAAIQKAKAL